MDRIPGYGHWLCRRVPIFRLQALASVLYHEIGHHIHATAAPEHGDGEDIADEWQRKLERRFLRRRYAYLRPVVLVIGAVLRAFGLMELRDGRLLPTPRMAARLAGGAPGSGAH